MTNKLPVRIRINKLKSMTNSKSLPLYTIPDEKGNLHPAIPEVKIMNKQNKKTDKQ